MYKNMDHIGPSKFFFFLSVFVCFLAAHLINQSDASSHRLSQMISSGGESPQYFIEAPQVCVCVKETSLIERSGASGLASASIKTKRQNIRE